MNHTLKSFLTVTIFSVLTRFLSFLFKIWMSRALGAEVVGLYQISLSVLLLLFSICAGAPTVLSRKIAEADGDIKKQNSLLTASLLLGGISAVAITAIFYALHSHLGALFADPACVPLFLIMLPTLVTSTLYASLRSWFWGRKKFLAFSSTELVDEVGKIALSAIFAGGLIGGLTGAKGVALAFTLSDLLCVLVLVILFFVSGGRLSKPQGAKSIITSTLPLSSMRILTSLSSSLTALVIPERLIKNGLTESLATAEFGRVSGMALPLIMAPVTVISALSVVLIPDIASLSAKGDLTTIKSKLKVSIVFSAVISALFFILYLPFGEILGRLFFGDATAGKYVSVCAALIFPISIANSTTPVINSLGMEKKTFLNYILGVAAMLPCIFFLPSLIGVYAMAVGSGIAFVITATLNLITLKKRLGKIEGLGACFGTIAFSIPLGFLGCFTHGVLSRYTGESLSMVLTAFYEIFFFIIFVSAFGVVDFKAFTALVLPAKISRHRPPETKNKKPRDSLKNLRAKFKTR